VAVTFESNAKGIATLGLTSDGKSFKEMVSGKTKALFAVGELPLKERPDTDFLVVLNAHITDLAKHADVVLPSAVFLESRGTIVDYKSRLKHLPMLVEPAGKSKPIRDVFAQLAKEMGSSIKKPTEAEIKKKLKEEQKLTPKAFKKQAELDVKPEVILESVCTSLLNSGRLLWLVETEKVIVSSSV
jgi:predicted molibdopterin-dependent oxidoreductase YjgC